MASNRHARTLEKLADQYERLLNESLVKFEKSIVNQLASAPTSADKLFDLQFALGMRQSLRETVEKEVLTDVHKAIANFDGAEKSLIEMYGASGIDEALLTVDRSIVRQLKKLTFQGFEDVAETFIDSISREIYQNTLTAKPLADSIRAVQHQINGVYIQTNDNEAQELVEFIAENKFDPAMESAVDAAVEQLHTKYARDRVGNNLRRYATQQLHDGLMQYSASINMKMANQLGAEQFEYFGTVAGNTRQWCKDHIGRIMTEQEIRDEWVNNSWAGKSSSDPFIARGGYNCRHHFRAVFDEDAIDEVIEDKPIQQFVSAKNIKDAETFAFEKGVKKVSYKGLSINDANAINKSLALEMGEGNLELLHISKDMEHPSAYMEASSPRKLIHFNAKEMKNVKFGNEDFNSKINEYQFAVKSLQKQYDSTSNKKLKAKLYNQISDYDIEIMTLQERQSSGARLLKWGAQEYASTKDEAIGMLFRHETGHLRFGKLPDKTKLHIKEIFKTTEFYTDYSKTSAEEYFAESFSLFRYGHHDKVDERLLKILEDI
jgi:hypothetical protein